jgi:hypothetical protein
VLLIAKIDEMCPAHYTVECILLHTPASIAVSIYRYKLWSYVHIA